MPTDIKAEQVAAALYIKIISLKIT